MDFIEKGDRVYYNMDYWNKCLKQYIENSFIIYHESSELKKFIISVKSVKTAMNYKDFYNKFLNTLMVYINNGLNNAPDINLEDYKYLCLFERNYTTNDYAHYVLVISKKKLMSLEKNSRLIMDKEITPFWKNYWD